MSREAKAKVDAAAPKTLREKLRMKKAIALALGEKLPVETESGHARARHLAAKARLALAGRTLQVSAGLDDKHVCDSLDAVDAALNARKAVIIPGTPGVCGATVEWVPDLPVRLAAAEFVRNSTEGLPVKRVASVGKFVSLDEMTEVLSSLPSIKRAQAQVVEVAA